MFRFPVYLLGHSVSTPVTTTLMALDLAPPSPLKTTGPLNDDTGPALLAALLSEAQNAKLVDLAPTVLATQDEELRSLLPSALETAPGTVGPATTGPTATSPVLGRSASGSAARGAWKPSDGPRLNVRSHRQKRNEAMQQNIRWSEGDPNKGVRRLHPNRANAVAHHTPRVVVHSVRYHGEAKTAPPHQSATHEASQLSKPRQAFDNPTSVASRILSEHAKAVRESERKSRRPASAGAAPRMGDDLATRMRYPNPNPNPNPIPDPNPNLTLALA